MTSVRIASEPRPKPKRWASLADKVRPESAQPLDAPALPLFLQRRKAPVAEGRVPTGPTVKIGPPDDAYEREADAVAERIMRTEGAAIAPAPPKIGLQRACAVCESDEDDVALQTKPATPTSTRSDGLAPARVPQALASPGRPLDSGARAYFEPRFGRDFSDVRVHDGALAQGSAKDVGALAYTVGKSIVFGQGRYAPTTSEGRLLLAHELTHVVQQASLHTTPRRFGGPAPGAPSALPTLARVTTLQRQCDPAWAGLTWAERVRNAKAAAAGTASNQCIADLLGEALTPNYTVEESTNSRSSVDQAARRGDYSEWGTLADLRVNFDRNLNTKTGNSNQYGETKFIVAPDGNDIDIFIVLGPAALDPVGPQYTEMAAHHEGEHAFDFLLQFAMIGSTPHGATAGEELGIHGQGFTRYMLDMWTIDNSTGAFRIANTFSAMFSNYPSAATAEQDDAFNDIKLFYEVRIANQSCNLMKFKIWLQMMQNAQSASDALVARINGLPDLGLTRNTPPSTHFDASLGCS